MRHISLFSGIGGIDLAFDRAGAETRVHVEYDRNCLEVLRRHFPKSWPYADIHDVKGSDLGRVDILSGGFPCQDISIAGNRAGLAGERSGLYWEFIRIVDETQPRWLLIENVQGLLSSGGRRDMGTVLGALADRGYGFAYRVLDAQFFGVPQRRRRVFIVARAGGSSDGPAQVLLEPEGVPGDPPKSRSTEEITAALTRSSLEGGGPDDNLAQAGHLIPVLLRMREGKPGGGKGPLLSEDRSLTIATGNDQTLFQSLAFTNQGGQTNLGLAEDLSPPVTGSNGNPPHVFDGYAVRKLMPIECERLQGFPDGWTEGHSDTTRYRMIGNAVAVPVVEWIARRLMAVEALEVAA